MKLDKNVCIRLDRDAEQIERSKQLLAHTKEQLVRQSNIWNLLGNQVRLSILLLLHKEGKLCVCDLSEILGMKIPAVSQHLRKLKDRDLVYSKRAGTVLFYSISGDYINMIGQVMQEEYLSL